MCNVVYSSTAAARRAGARISCRLCRGARDGLVAQQHPQREGRTPGCHPRRRACIPDLAAQAGRHRQRCRTATQIPKLPSSVRWMWDGEFCGRSACAGSRAPTRCRAMCLAISAMRWCRGNAVAATRPRRCGMMLGRGARGRSRAGRDHRPTRATSPRAASSRRNGGRFVEEFVQRTLWPMASGCAMFIDLESRTAK